jgi:hypothetical protein
MPQQQDENIASFMSAQAASHSLVSSGQLSRLQQTCNLAAQLCTKVDMRPSRSAAGYRSSKHISRRTGSITNPK